MTDLTGQLIAGRYRVQRTLGEGGVGSLYVALQQPLEREVALKVVRADLLHGEKYRPPRSEARQHHARGAGQRDPTKLLDCGLAKPRAHLAARGHRLRGLPPINGKCLF